MNRIKPILIVVVVLGLLAIAILQWPRISALLPDNLPIVGRGQPSEVTEFPQVPAQPAQEAPIAPGAAPTVPPVPTLAPPAAPAVSQPQGPVGPGAVDQAGDTIGSLVSGVDQKTKSVREKVLEPFSRPVGEAKETVTGMPVWVLLIYAVLLVFVLPLIAGWMRRVKAGASQVADEAIPSFLMPRGVVDLGSTLYLVMALGLVAIALVLLGKGESGWGEVVVKIIEIVIGGLGLWATIDGWGESFLNTVSGLDVRNYSLSSDVRSVGRQVLNWLFTAAYSVPFALFILVSLFLLFVTAAGSPFGINLLPNAQSVLPRIQGAVFGVIPASGSQWLSVIIQVLSLGWVFFFTGLDFVIPAVSDIRTNPTTMLVVSVIVLGIVIYFHRPGRMNTFGGRRRPTASIRPSAITLTGVEPEE